MILKLFFSPRSGSLNLDTLDVTSPDLTNACHVPGRKKMLRTCWGEVTSRNCGLVGKGTMRVMGSTGW